jgi:hypothetical protein
MVSLTNFGIAPRKSKMAVDVTRVTDAVTGENLRSGVRTCSTSFGLLVLRVLLFSPEQALSEHPHDTVLYWDAGVQN